jgi:predicted ATPase/DNA-binding SARP family transcriptional activator
VTTDQPQTLDIGLLGPIRVLRDGAQIDIGGVRAETLLALLALRAASPVSADSLVEELWAGEAPDGAATTLRSYVSRLRGSLGDAAPIDRVSAGYVLAVPAEWIDVARFESLIREGGALLERRRYRRAAETFRSALELWRGRPFAGLAEDGAFQAEIVRLEELRLHALDSRLEADLELGRAAEIVDELEALVAEHPFRERLWRHLMLALYRAGRQADALAAYHRARTALDEQLGLEPGEELRELEGAILRQDVPSADQGRRPSHGVPVPLTSFVGRARELDQVRTLLQRARLVTLVGVGGVGKTRLALEAARRALDDAVDSVAFVDLAALSDPGLVPAHVAASLGVREAPGQELTAAVAEQVGSTEFLLVLDNCEHVREAAANLAQTLLEGSADLHILATSREVLDVPGEAAYPVAPLALPEAGDDLGVVRASEAVRLLVDRATLTRHDLRVDDATYETAARICRELDGLPLAIELAAARTKALSLDEIAEKLRDRFQFLVSWRRLSAARHRTLREAMDWSYELLAPDEQRLLARLSVFPAGATLASVASVCVEDDENEAGRLIERLVDASLVVPIDDPDGTRYRLLETVRQYAAERLPDSELADLNRRHAERMRTIAASTNLALEGTGRAMSYDQARIELPSIRAAIQWAVEADPALGIEIAAALERFWVTNHAREGIAIFTALLAGDGIPDEIRALGLRCRGGCRYYVADFDWGAGDYEAALAIHRQRGERRYEAHLLQRLAIEAYRVGDRKRAREMYEEAARIGGADRFIADEYVGLRLLSDLAFDEGDADEGFAVIRQAIDGAAAAGDDWWEIDGRASLADRALDLGMLDEAGRAAREALRLARKIDDRQSIVLLLAILSVESAARGLGHRAGRLWGGLAAEVERGGPVGQWEALQDRVREQAAAKAGADFQPGVAEGRALSIDEVVAEAFEQP